MRNLFHQVQGLVDEISDRYGTKPTRKSFDTFLNDHRHRASPIELNFVASDGELGVERIVEESDPIATVSLEGKTEKDAWREFFYLIQDASPEIQRRYGTNHSELAYRRFASDLRNHRLRLINLIIARKDESLTAEQRIQHYEPIPGVEPVPYTPKTVMD